LYTRFVARSDLMVIIGNLANSVKPIKETVFYDYIKNVIVYFITITPCYCMNCLNDDLFAIVVIFLCASLASSIACLSTSSLRFSANFFDF